MRFLNYFIVGLSFLQVATSRQSEALIKSQNATRSLRNTTSTESLTKSREACVVCKDELVCTGCQKNELCSLIPRTCNQCGLPQCVPDPEANSTSVWVIVGTTLGSITVIILAIVIIYRRRSRTRYRANLEGTPLSPNIEKSINRNIESTPVSPTRASKPKEFSVSKLLSRAILNKHLKNESTNQTQIDKFISLYQTEASLQSKYDFDAHISALKHDDSKSNPFSYLKPSSVSALKSPMSKLSKRFNSANLFRGNTQNKNNLELEINSTTASNIKPLSPVVASPNSPGLGSSSRVPVTSRSSKIGPIPEIEKPLDVPSPIQHQEMGPKTNHQSQLIPSFQLPFSGRQSFLSFGPFVLPLKSKSTSSKSQASSNSK